VRTGAIHGTVLVVQFDPTRLSEVADPFPLYAAQRAEAPVARSDGGFWCVTGYDEAAAVLRSPAATSGFIGARYRDALPEGSAARTELGYRINFLDPPDHTRVRHHVGRAWTPRRVADLRGWVEGLADRLLDEAERAGGPPVGARRLDLYPIAHALPSQVISELLGVPGADRELLAELTELTAPLLGVSVSSADMAAGLDASERFADYVNALLDERRRAPGDDLLSALLAEPLSHDELQSLVVTLYAAGHRTTRDLFGRGLVALLEAGQVDAARGDLRRAADELVRYSTPTHYVARVLTEPVGDVPAWEPVLLFLAAANRDPRRFDDPERLDVRREPDPPALSFVLGPHHCLGANLARMEVEVLLGAVLRRWPELRLDGDPGWRCTGPFRGVERLPVAV
jgi:cytochrome P450